MTYRVNFNTDTCEIYAGRGGKWGNPFPIGICGTREEVLEQHENYVFARPELIEAICRELKGRVLGCHCQSYQACHADFLARIANGHQMAFELKEI